MAIGEDRPIHLRHDVVDFHAFQSLRLCHVINVCPRSEVDGTRNVVLESARRQISHQGGTRHNVHGYSAEFMWLRAIHIFRIDSERAEAVRALLCGVNSSRGHLQRGLSISAVRLALRNT